MAEENKEYIVCGYKFADENDYNAALSEKKGIKYLSTRINLNDTDKTAKLYCELVEKDIFHTPVGLEFMKKLRAAIIKKGGPGDLPYVKISASGIGDSKNTVNKFMEKDTAARNNAKHKNYKEKLRTSVIINVVLFLLVGAMFGVALSSSNPNIINYERALQDKYAGWAQELDCREESLRQREKELEQKENQQERNIEEQESISQN